MIDTHASTTGLRCHDDVSLLQDFRASDAKEYADWQKRHTSLENQLSQLSDDELINSWGKPKSWNTTDEDGYVVDISYWIIPTGRHVRIDEIAKDENGNFCYVIYPQNLAIEVTNQTTSGKTKRYIRTVVN